ncbi:ATP-grasp domain-containing protein [Micromonospora sp. NPDC050417]|uniref:ATP-grasp domain-containing protein n=1 Tax=Micromonospora sp. NPDC050417 TaxID=3364280 RepID=UPI0037873804
MSLVIDDLAALPPGIEIVAVGFSRALLSDLGALVPARSVLVLEEPDVIAARRVEAIIDSFTCAGALLPAPTQDEDGALRFAATLNRPDGVRAVVPAVEYGVVVAAALAAAWGLPGAGVAAAETLRDKARLRAAVGGDVPQPDWLVVSTAEDIDQFRAKHEGRCVLKPTNRQASLGVHIMSPEADAATVLAAVAGADEPKLRASTLRRGTFLVESVLDGPEISHEALVLDGRVVFANTTAKQVRPGARPVETGHLVPGPLPARTANAVEAAVGRFVAAIGYRTGVLHSEWILVDGQPHLVECAGRLPGDHIDVLIDLAYPGSLLSDYLAILSRHSAPGRRQATATAAIRFLDLPGGVVEAVDGVDDATVLEDVVEVEVDVMPGDRVRSLASSWDRVGHVIVRSVDAAGASAAVDAALEKINVKVTADG